MSERIKITVLRGVAGYVLAVNDKRVAGPKSGPYKTLAEWKIDPAGLPALAAEDRTAAAERRAEAAERALENVRMLAVSRYTKIGGENADHLIRFCREAGVDGSPLHAASPSRKEPSP